jgi:hypothetical protein
LARQLPNRNWRDWLDWPNRRSRPILDTDRIRARRAHPAAAAKTHDNGIARNNNGMAPEYAMTRRTGSQTVRFEQNPAAPSGAPRPLARASQQGLTLARHPVVGGARKTRARREKTPAAIVRPHPVVAVTEARLGRQMAALRAELRTTAERDTGGSEIPS